MWCQRMQAREGGREERKEGRNDIEHYTYRLQTIGKRGEAPFSQPLIQRFLDQRIFVAEHGTVAGASGVALTAGHSHHPLVESVSVGE
jgi:hypothetical protein